MLFLFAKKPNDFLMKFEECTNTTGLTTLYYSYIENEWLCDISKRKFELYLIEA